MGTYRTYFDKNNTIIKNSLINTGRNPVSELYYGAKTSRFLFYCSFIELINKVNNKEIIIDDSTKHILKIKNTTNVDVSQFLNDSNNLVYGDKYIASSIDLELKMVDEYWDEGLGYDFDLKSNSYVYNRDYNQEPSNWTKRTTTDEFIISGGVNTLNSLATQHLSLGNEDISMDITDFVNDYIQGNFTGVTTGDTTGGTTGITTNYQGFCLKFNSQLENITGETKTNVLGLLTRHTQTFFEPYIETTYNDNINDERLSFYLNKNNYLYLFVNVGNKLTNLDQLPTCSITGETTGKTYNVTQLSKGIYYATISGDTNDFNTLTEYNDVWSNIIINGEVRPNVTLSFIPKSSESYYELNDTINDCFRYFITLSGINKDEKLLQGINRRVKVLLRKQFTSNNNIDIADDIYYRLYVKQGHSQIDIIDWEKVNKVYNDYYFNIDTSWLIPQEYHIDIKIITNGETNIYSDILSFKVANKLEF